MAAIVMREMHSLSERWKEFLGREASVHPVLAVLISFVVCPCVLVGAVLAGVSAVMLPVALLMGWL